MKKSRILSIILITISVSLMLCGTVMAYMFHQTQYEDNHFTPAYVSCTVEEEFDGQQKTSIKVLNTGNIDAYIRVRLVSYWVDTEGKIVAKPSEMPIINLASGWLSGANNTYYYQSPVDDESSTNDLLSSTITLDKDMDGNLQVVEVFAEAMQSKPIEAVSTNWGVAIDESGYIIAVP